MSLLRWMRDAAYMARRRRARAHLFHGRKLVCDVRAIEEERYDNAEDANEQARLKTNVLRLEFAAKHLDEVFMWMDQES